MEMKDPVDLLREQLQEAKNNKVWNRFMWCKDKVIDHFTLRIHYVMKCWWWESENLTLLVCKWSDIYCRQFKLDILVQVEPLPDRLL